MSDISRGVGWWVASDGKWYPPDLHPSHGESPEPQQLGPQVHGTAGASAQANADRWGRGAEGERATAAVLAQLPQGWIVIHDLKIPGSKANIDHVAIGPTGVRVIDSKAWGANLVERDGTLWDGSHSIEDKIATIEWMTGIVSHTTGKPADAVLCFVANNLPRAAQMVGRTRFVELESLLELLTAGPPVYQPEEVERIATEARALRLPPLPPQPMTARAEPTATATTRRGPKPSQANKRRSLPSGSNTPTGAKKERKGQPVLAVLAEFVFSCVLLYFGGRWMISTVLDTFSRPVANAVPAEATCPAAGAGWSVNMKWPGEVAGLERYTVDATVAGLPLPLGDWKNADEVHPPLAGLAPSTKVVITAIAVTDKGKSPPRTTTVDTPPTPC